MLQLAPSRNARRAASLGLAGAAAVLLSGCYGITDQTAAQLDVVGKIHVKTDLCITGGQPSLPFPGSPPADPTDERGCVTDAPAHAHALQLFVTYEVPAGTDVPSTIKGSGKLAGVTFTKSQAFTDALAATPSNPEQELSVEGRVSLPGDDEPEVVSYASSVLPKQAAYTGAQEAAVDADFGAVGVDDDAFFYRTGISWRWVDEAVETLSATRPIACGNTGPSSQDTNNPLASCNYDKRSDAVPLNQLTLSAPGEDYPSDTYVASGATATLRFGATSKLGQELKSEQPAEVAAELTATTTVPGATVTAPSEYTLGADGSVAVTVAVPKATADGLYDVTLSTADDQVGHVATAKLRVYAGPPAEQPVAEAPKANGTTPAPAPLTVPQKLAGSASAFAAKTLGTPEALKALKKGKGKLATRIELPARGTARVSLLGNAKGKKKAPVIAVGTATSSTGGLTDLVLKRTDEGKKYLGGRKTVHGTLVVKFEGRDGKTTVSTGVTLTLN